jgi:hypothetical protein
LKVGSRRRCGREDSRSIPKWGRVLVGKERQVNARFLAMASHYLFDAEFCNPASGWEKDQVEKNVQDARHRLWQPTPRFPALEALNDWLEQRCKALWQENPHGSQPGTIAEVWASEAPTMTPFSRPFDGFVEHSKRVSPTCLVQRASIMAATMTSPRSAPIASVVAIFATGR